MTCRLMATIVALIALAVPGVCGTANADDTPPVVLGAVYNLIGGQADLDVPSLNGARLAVAEANQAAGPDGRKVALAVADGASLVEMLPAKTRALIKTHPSMAALMGLSDTDMVLAAAPAAAENGRVFLTSGATSPRLPAEVPEYLFLACFGDNVQAAAAAEWAYDHLSARTVSVLYNDTVSYTKLLHGYFQERFTGLGGQVVSAQPYTPGGAAQGAELMGTADIVFLAAANPEEALSEVRQLRQAGITAPIVGGDGFDDPEMWRVSPNVDQWRTDQGIRDVYYTTHAYVGADSTDKKVLKFRQAYMDANPGEDPTAFSALGYDTARLLMTAVSDAGSTEPKAVREALAGIRSFDGISGTISYPDGSRIPTKTVTILGVDQGHVTLVDQLAPKDVPAP
jgi:branched-chain amino acid transport system substrate-binding protein